MTVLMFLIPLAIVLGGGGLAMFVWTIHSRQYEDLEGDARRILLDDETPTAPPPAS
jgi:cbb3-type cytochrome oxidase maturation protein